ncbi:MAG: hypothetical protein Q9M91_02840 [Candidatus Dojkabacteria bacterium]|nr:hypothetical protein [Candidatus Dojkabacteria bacterium]
MLKGGTWITFDSDKKCFIERYLNRSIWDRGTEDYTRELTQKELVEMFEKELYTDRKYIFLKKSEEYEMRGRDFEEARV